MIQHLPSTHPPHCLPTPVKWVLLKLYWLNYDFIDFMAEAIGWLPFHSIRLFLYRYILKIHIDVHTSIHKGCRFYNPSGTRIGKHTVVNRDVLLDSRRGIQIGDNVSISEGTVILTLEHDPTSPIFKNRGAPVHIEDYVFVGTRAMILPGITIGKGAIVGAGAIITRDVAPFTIVAGIPARPIGKRTEELSYTLNYRKFLG